MALLVTVNGVSYYECAVTHTAGRQRRRTREGVSARGGNRFAVPAIGGRRWRNDKCILSCRNFKNRRVSIYLIFIHPFYSQYMLVNFTCYTSKRKRQNSGLSVINQKLHHICEINFLEDYLTIKFFPFHNKTTVPTRPPASILNTLMIKTAVTQVRMKWY